MVTSLSLTAGPSSRQDRVLAAALTLWLGALAGCAPEPAVENDSADTASPVETVVPQLVQADGSYPGVPLEKYNITLKVIQSDVEQVGGPWDTASLDNNLDRMLELGQQACEEGSKPDILLYHEFPLTGYVYGDRDDKLEMALTIPGPKSDALGELARDCDTYLIFGAYAKDEQWPGHVLNLTTIIGRDGEVADVVWKPRNIKRFYDTFEISTTTVESVRTRFREMYGVEREIPILQTEFGNIGVSTAQLDPILFAAMAAQGAEIILRSSTLFFEHDVIYTAQAHNVYSAMANIPYDSEWGGRSMIVSPDGEILAQDETVTEEAIISATIPIMSFRNGRTIPHYTTELTDTVMSQYVQEIPLDHMDMPEDELPEDGEAMKDLLDTVSRWLNPDD